MKHALSLGLALIVVWLLWSGHFTPLLISAGVLSCAAVVWTARKMGLADAEGVPLDQLPRALAYLPWLLWEIVKSNLAVARIILSPRLPISPRVVRMPPSQRTELGAVIHANSITLTPGTVSIAVEDGCILVHALTREAAQGVLDGSIDRRATRVEGRH